MSSHYIYFYGELEKIMLEFLLNTPPLTSPLSSDNGLL